MMECSGQFRSPVTAAALHVAPSLRYSVGGVWLHRALNKDEGNNNIHEIVKKLNEFSALK
jgi:hypothetical protein